MIDIYVSTDIEADGPIPGVNSMLSLGAVAYKLTPGGPVSMYEELGRIQVNLEPLPGAVQDERTMTEFWAKNPEAWKASTERAVKPEVGMRAFVDWMNDLCRNHNGRPTLVAYPATYDFMWVYWYTIKFCGFPAPFGFSGIDLKTMAATILDIPFRDATKKNMPRAWFRGAPRHSHKAVEDAEGQGILFMNMMLRTRS